MYAYFMYVCLFYVFALLLNKTEFSIFMAVEFEKNRR